MGHSRKAVGLYIFQRLPALFMSSPRTYFVISSVFNFCNEVSVSSVPVTFSEPESKTGRKGEKIHYVLSEKC